MGTGETDGTNFAIYLRKIYEGMEGVELHPPLTDCPGSKETCSVVEEGD